MSVEDSHYYEEAKDQYRDALEDADQWDERIARTGCYIENAVLQLCHAETGDWRQCAFEMQLLRDCWQQRATRSEQAGDIDSRSSN